MTHPVAAIQALERECAGRLQEARSVALGVLERAQEEEAQLIQEAHEAGRDRADRVWDQQLAEAEREGARRLAAAAERAAQIERDASTALPALVEALVALVLPGEDG